MDALKIVLGLGAISAVLTVMAVMAVCCLAHFENAAIAEVSDVDMPIQL